MDISDEQWQTGIDSTLLNIVRMVRLVAPSMAENGWGRIVHVTSLVAREPNDLLPISSTIRSGIEALTKVQSNALAKHGITVNTVQPGHTLTDRQTHLCTIRAEQNGTSMEHEIAMQAKVIPVGRMGKPEEIGAAAAFLCSQQAAFITGTSVLIDGGMVKGI
jgi:3-oxoacyl-[acyl-carrier protein] reductase